MDERARSDKLKRTPEGIAVNRGVRGPDDPMYHMGELQAAAETLLADSGDS